MKHQDNDLQSNDLTRSCNQWHRGFSEKAEISDQAVDENSGSGQRLMWAISRERPPGDEYFQSDDSARGRPPNGDNLLFWTATCKKPVGVLHLMPLESNFRVPSNFEGKIRDHLCEISPADKHLPPDKVRGGPCEADENLFLTETMKKPPGYEYLQAETDKISELTLQGNFPKRTELHYISPGDKHLPPVKVRGGPCEADGNLLPTETMKKPPGYEFLLTETDKISELTLHGNFSKSAEMLDISPGDKHLPPVKVRGGPCEADGNLFPTETMKKPPGYEFLLTETDRISELTLHNNIPKRAGLPDISPGDKYLPPDNVRGGPCEADGKLFRMETMKKPLASRNMFTDEGLPKRVDRQNPLVFMTRAVQSLLPFGINRIGQLPYEIPDYVNQDLPHAEMYATQPYGTPDLKRALLFRKWYVKTVHKEAEKRRRLSSFRSIPNFWNAGDFYTSTNKPGCSIYVRMARDGISGMLREKYYRMPRNGTDILPYECRKDGSYGAGCGTSFSMNRYAKPCRSDAFVFEDQVGALYPVRQQMHNAIKQGSALFRKRKGLRLNRFNTAVMGMECSHENESKYDFYQLKGEFPFARSTRNDLQYLINQRFEKLRKSLLSDSFTRIQRADKTTYVNQNQLEIVKNQIRFTKSKHVEWYSA